MIAALEKARSVAVGATRLVLSIESALGVINAYTMSTAAARVASISFGGAKDGDLNTDLGSTWSSDGPEMMTARGMTLIAARAARFDIPLDGVFADVRDPPASNRIPPSPADLATAAASSSTPRRSSPATGSTRRASKSSITVPACWRRSKRRWRGAAPQPRWTAR